MNGSNNKYHDLCSVCRHARTCIKCEKHRSPIWYCDRFEELIVSSDQKKNNMVAGKKVPSKSINMADREIEKSMGLCYSCRKRDTCTKPRPEGGVWHCEDYC